MGAFPPATDHVSLFAEPGVDDPVIHVLAEWATQFNLPYPSRFPKLVPIIK
jgi:hypothetical protein